MKKVIKFFVPLMVCMTILISSNVTNVFASEGNEQGIEARVPAF